jgi:hypothetical protein
MRNFSIEDLNTELYMNIKDHFNNAKVLLENASEKVDSGDYKDAQDNLAKSYSHTRALIVKVQKLIALKESIKAPAGENGG